ncbi:MAG TPA: hypothetical protein IAA98_06000 [Candidatus Avipropionibacterium avicola]|uniref:DUF3558 domain-containing protein n=1 Tax=Candidatus Avipropionibacterium avicola TaxID=2840701 RepID=A0A9D1GWK7_9ACTN|nr:hypothetical protein [Candidatus Avipropionibacterium avicola]
MRGLTAAVSAVILVASAVLSGCTPARDLPEMLPPEQVRALDLCALVPFDEVKQRHPDLKFNYGSRLVLGPDSCWFQVATGSSVWIQTEGEPLPTWIAKDDPDEVTASEVPGGVVLTRELNRDPFCDVAAVSDAGLVLDVALSPATPAEAESQCSLANDLATVALAHAGEELPTIAWPEDSLYSKDICGFAEQSGLIVAAGLEGQEIEPNASARDCDVDRSNDATPFHSLELTAQLGQPAAENGARGVTVDGRDAVLYDQAGVTCELTIDFGNNPVLAEVLGTKTAHENLLVKAAPAEGVSCSTLVELVEPVLGSL